MKANYTYYCRNCDSDFITEESLKFCPNCAYENEDKENPLPTLEKDKNFVIEIGTNLTLILILFLVFLWTKGCQ